MVDEANTDFSAHLRPLLASNLLPFPSKAPGMRARKHSLPPPRRGPAKSMGGQFMTGTE